MSGSDLAQTELRALIGAMLDGQLTDAEESRLVELASASPAAMELYVHALEVHAVLAWETQWSSPADTGAEPVIAPRRWRSAALRGAAIRYAAAAVIVLVIGMLVNVMITASAVRRSAGGGGPVATLIDAERAVWEDADPPQVGSALPSRLLHLRSGWAELETTRGVTIRLHGPCELAINSPMYCRPGG